jgi:hypothetical protein
MCMFTVRFLMSDIEVCEENHVSDIIFELYILKCSVVLCSSLYVIFIFP